MRNDDWITKLYIQEFLTNNMKYTEQGLIRIIKTEPILFNWMFDNSMLSPTSIELEMEFLEVEPKIEIHGQDVKDWLFELLYDKVVTTANNNTDDLVTLSKLVSGHEPLFVEEYGLEYLIKQLYHIINVILENGNKLLSIKLI